MSPERQRQYRYDTTGGAISRIDYERYLLPNGLDVILHQDRKAPIVHVLVWYHVGSKNEPADKTGFAHLFEHMMFQGSENVGKTEHFAYVQGAGGTLNASTGQDRTNYFQTLPSEYLGLGLWLEADRMRSLEVTDENFANQLAVVKEERKQNYDNRPYGLWYLTMLDMLFGGTSYGWGPIGDMAHLEASSIETVQEFHRRFYVPNNATLVVAGDFDTAEAKQMIAELFGEIPRGEEILPPQFRIEALDGQLRRRIYDRIPHPALMFGFHGVPIGHPDAAPLAILSSILTRGRSSRLVSSLVYEQQLMEEVRAFSSELESAGAFMIHGVISDGVTLEQAEEALWSRIESVLDAGVTGREITAALNAIESGLVRLLWSIRSVSDLLARFQVLRGDASRINSLIEEYRAVTPEMVERVARTYLCRDACAVLHYLPAGRTE
jgi:predicted Zn-dependent peptidase